MRDEEPGVDGQRRAVEVVEVLGEGPPCEVDARGGALVGDLLDDLEAAQQYSSPPGGQGATPKPHMPPKTVVTPWWLEGDAVGVQQSWASRWVWGSMMPGITKQPEASISSAAVASSSRPTSAIRPPERATSAANGATPAVDQRPAPDHEVVHPLSLAHFRSRV